MKEKYNMTFLFNKVYLYALIGLFIIGFLYRVFRAGQDREKLNQAQGDLDAVVTRNEIRDDVNHMSDSTIVNELRKHGWFKESD